MISLAKYQSKRNLAESREPAAKKGFPSSKLSFCVQKHAARRLHYDFRLEYRGVLLSWAVPKGPSLNPHDKRLAIMVEDHPLDYRHFEGVIPKGNYGAGSVMIWDQGTYTVPNAVTRKDIENQIQAGLKKGHLDIILNGQKLCGGFLLIQLKQNPEENAWLLIKKTDEFATSRDVERLDRSSTTDRTMAEIADDQPYKQHFLSNLDKVFWPKEKITKGDLLHYYETIAPYIIPHLKNRPIVLYRFPNGIAEEGFYQKEMSFKPQKGIHTVPVKHEEKTINYLLIDDVKSLLYAVNLGSIDLHPFTARYKKLDYPDYCVIDLDPHGISFEKVIETALQAHEILDEIQTPHYCKTSGGNGLHIYIPLHAKYDYEQSRQFAELIASCIHQRLPGFTSLERSPKKRPKKIYLDFLQNRERQTVVAPYAVRPRPGAYVSTPLLWQEVKKGLSPQQFTMQNIPSRLKKMGDIFKPTLGPGINMPKALKQLKKWLAEGELAS